MCCSAIHHYWWLLPIGVGVIIWLAFSAGILGGLWNRDWVVNGCDGRTKFSALKLGRVKALERLALALVICAGVIGAVYVMSGRHPWFLLVVSGVIWFVLVCVRFASKHVDGCSCGADYGGY